MEQVKSDRIVLDSYAEVLRKGESYRVIIRALPEGCSEDDLTYESSDSTIAYVQSGEITAKNSGSTQIIVKTKDGKHQAYVNILVSTQ